MPKSCAVCRRLDRAEIDLKLARHQVNMAQIARDIGCGETTVRRHRDQHVPSFLAVYGANAELPSVGSIHGELLRLYTSTLDALALAEAGTLEGLNEDGSERRKVSHTAVQGYVREARRLLGEITALAADAGTENERPTGMARGELAKRIMDRLDAPRVHNYADTAPALTPSVVSNDALDCIPIHDSLTSLSNVSHSDVRTEGPADTPTRGGQAGGGGAPNTPEMALDAAMAPKTSTPDLPGIASHPRLQQVIKDHEATKQSTNPEESPALLTAPNPNYPGSPASSKEERAAAGYPDVDITEEDIKSLPDEVRRLIAEHRANAPANPPAATPTPSDES